jgi:hypothetical protein
MAGRTFSEAPLFRRCIEAKSAAIPRFTLCPGLALGVETLSAQAQLLAHPRAMTAVGGELKRLADKWPMTVIALGSLLTIVWLGLGLFYVCRQRFVDRPPLLRYRQRSHL